MTIFADIPLPTSWTVADEGPLVGIWAGYWGDVIPHVLIICENGSCIYAVGAVPAWHIEAGFRTVRSSTIKARLVLESPGLTVDYWREGTDTMAGRYRSETGGDTWGRFTRVQKALLGSQARLPSPVWGEAVRIPHQTGTLAGMWHSPAAGPAPLAVLSHGSSDGVDPRAPITMEGEARWLRDQGYAVLVPMRRGRGSSDGVHGEINCCNLESRLPVDCSIGLAEAVEDLRSAIAFGIRQPGVQAGPVLLAGQSRGGFLSIVYAGLQPTEVSGVISFVGGWTADWCNGSFNTRTLAAAGAGQGPQQLWIHADNDGYYSSTHVRENHTAFTRAGGRAELHMLSDLPVNGHLLARFPDRWTDPAASYLQSVGV